MGSVKFNGYEHDALRGLPLNTRCLYFELRSRMDFSTGLVGARRGAAISWQCFCEWLFVEPHPGRQNTGTPHKSSVRRAASWLEDAGLVKNLSRGKRLIFECLLADTDRSDWKQADTNPTNRTEQDKSQVIPISSKGYKGGDNLNDTNLSVQADKPPVSGLDSHIDINKIPNIEQAVRILIDSGVEEQRATQEDHIKRLQQILDEGATIEILQKAAQKARSAKLGKPFSIFYMGTIIKEMRAGVDKKTVSNTRNYRNSNIGAVLISERCAAALEEDQEFE